MDYKKQTYAERMDGPLAIYMSPETFGQGHHGPILYCGEYTHAAFMAAAVAWAGKQPGQPEQNTEAMQRAIACSGIRPEHIETPRTGYLGGWSRYLISLFEAQLKPRTRIAPDVLQDVRDALATPRYYNVASPDPVFTQLEVRPKLSYGHVVTIDGVRWGVESLLNSMAEIEYCDSESGAASLHGNGRDTMLVELLSKHAGLTSAGGYHSAPRYEANKWQAFREKLELLMETI